MDRVKKSFGSGACLGLLALALSACAGSQQPAASSRATGSVRAMPLDLSLALKMARDMRRAGHPDEAIGLLQLNIAHGEPDPELLIELGRLQIAAGRPQEAEAMLTEALRQVPDHMDANHVMAIALDRQNRPEAARPYYHRALAHEPENANLLNNLGLSLALAGDGAGAVEILERAAALSPASAQITANLRFLQSIVAPLPSAGG